MKIKFIKNKYFFVLILFLIFSSFLIGNYVYADVGLFSSVLGWIISIIINALGELLSVLIWALIWIAQYNDFIDSPAVINGWVIMRDLCNMFFVVIFLIIAFATILKIETYNIKKLLPKLLIMAVAINFSRTICGVLIDLSQVVMLTFVNSFKEIGGGNLADMLGITKILDLDPALADKETNFLTIFSSYVLALLYVLIALVVITTMVAVLAMRIVLIWIYVVLAPLAFLLYAFPAGQSYAKRWWEDFSKQLAVGPILAFFIWLSFVSAATGLVNVAPNPDKPSAGGAVAGSADNIIKFIISIGLLIGGLREAEKIGGDVGKIAGKGLGAAKNVLSGAAKVAGAPLKGAQMGAGALAGFGVDKVHQKTGVDLNLSRAWKGLQEKRAEKKAERYSDGVVKARQVMAEGGRMHGALAMTGAPGDAWEQITTMKGLKQRIKGGAGMMRDRKVAQGKIEEAEKPMNDLIKERSGILTTEERKEQVEEKNSGIEDTKNEIKEKEAEYDKTEKAGLTSENMAKMRVLSEEADGLKEKKKKQEEERDNIPRADDNKATALDNQIAEKRSEYEEVKGKNQSIVDENVPMYAFEARATEQKAVSEKTSKIKDNTDPNELFKILEDSIKNKDKTMIKAITKKMTKEANDNEFLQPLVGNTGHHGLKQLMRDFSDKKSDNYAGFDEQEAYSLGSEIAEINKGTNHWAATSAYEMKDGRWEETDDKTHAEIRSIETGKMEPQAICRNINRLGYGYHDKGGEFHIDAGGLLLIKKIDNPGGQKSIKERMDESGAKHIYNALTDGSGKFKKEFEKEFSPELLKALKDRLGKVAGENFESQYEKVKNFD